MLPQAAKWAECSSGTPTLPYHAIVQQGSEELDADHQSARHAGKSPITQNGKGGANPGHDGKSARHAGKSPINQNGKGGANPGHDAQVGQIP
jgi:hypothetical protein